MKDGKGFQADQLLFLQAIGIHFGFVTSKHVDACYLTVKSHSSCMRFRHAFAILKKTGCELWRAGRDMALASSSVLRGEITAVDGQQKEPAAGTTSTS